LAKTIINFIILPLFNYSEPILYIESLITLLIVVANRSNYYNIFIIYQKVFYIDFFSAGIFVLTNKGAGL